jgi:hypothetical protein
MTVKELIEQLSALENQDAIVMVRGYEGGYIDASEHIRKPVDMALNVNKEWFYGPHELAEGVNGKYEIVKAIIL